MVQIVLAEVVLGQVGDVGKLHVRNILWAKEADIHIENPVIDLDYLFFCPRGIVVMEYQEVPLFVIGDRRCCVQMLLFGVGAC